MPDSGKLFSTKQIYFQQMKKRKFMIDDEFTLNSLSFCRLHVRLNGSFFFAVARRLRGESEFFDGYGDPSVVCCFAVCAGECFSMDTRLTSKDFS